jgi:polysaccharide biosynthesis/export protein
MLTALLALFLQASATPPPADYVVGVDDILLVVFVGEAAMSGEVVVRPDGMITPPIMGDVSAIGLTPSALADRLGRTAIERNLLKAPSVTVTLKELRSRKVFVIGAVAKPGPIVLSTPLTVIQALSLAGGVGEFAKRKQITILRMLPDGKSQVFRFNDDDVARGRNVQQNIELRPGDTIVVP